jgi:transposase
MNNDKYIGMDVHRAMISIVVLSESGQVQVSATIPTQTEPIVAFLEGQRGRLHVTFEEGTWAAWLYDLLVSRVARLVVCDPRHNALLQRGSKSDPLDARKLAELLRLNALRPVYHGERSVQTLKELARSYQSIMRDATRVMNRLKALYRARGIACAGRGVYALTQRASWLAQLQGEGVRSRAELLYQELDLLGLLHRQARLALLKESRKHAACQRLRQVPGLGPLRVALLLAFVQTPCRFRNVRLFWAYVGLGLVTHISAEFCLVNGQVTRSRKHPLARGLNRNFQPDLKEIFKAAATCAIVRPGPWQDYYQQRVKAWGKPHLVRLTVARKLAALTLTLWKKGGRYDAEQVKSPVA